MNTGHYNPHRQATSHGSVLVAVLWCVVLLSVMVIGLLHSTRLELRVAKNQSDRIRARYLANAGIEKAKALLFHEAKSRREGFQNTQSVLYDAPEYFKDIEFGGGMYRIIRQARQEESGPVVYGVSDEESRLNVNTASMDELNKLPEMEPSIASSIVDYRDGDDQLSPGGAEAEAYMSVSPPYLPRNGRFLTDRELLMVLGMPVERFLGEDTNMNGLLDPEEDDGNLSEPQDNGDGILGSGWSGMMGVHAMVENLNFKGKTRVNVQSADESELMTLNGITSDIAAAIVAYRGENQFKSIADLLDVRQQAADGNNQANRPNPDERNNSNPNGNNNNNGNSFTGPALIGEGLFQQIADDVTVSDAYDLPGVVNINSASMEVLACLPGINEELASTIVRYRESYGHFASVADLLSVPGVNAQILKQLIGRVTDRSETFRIMCEGKTSGTGARHRIEVVVRVLSDDVEMLAYREDL